LWSANDRAFRHLADDGRYFTDRAVRLAGIVVGIVNAAPVVIFSVAQQAVSTRRATIVGLVAVHGGILHRGVDVDAQ
jgi:hypothetical protein